jgi:SAM-dependent methyltransferase
MTPTPTLIVPPELNRSSSTVSSLMPPEESGQWLLRRMQHQIGFPSYATKSMLDFGCGVRFTQAIINLQLPIGEYAGVDCFPTMIDFLSAKVTDPRFSFHRIDAYHPLYNPTGTPLTPSSPLALPEHHFDIVCMFSVITHQYPRDAESIFSRLRRHVGPSGHLFFTCFLDDTIDSFEDRSEERNGGRCFYSSAFLQRLVVQTGWIPIARYPAEPPLIGDSFICRPAQSSPS